MKVEYKYSLKIDKDDEHHLKQRITKFTGYVIMAGHQTTASFVHISDGDIFSLLIYWLMFPHITFTPMCHYPNKIISVHVVKTHVVKTPMRLRLYPTCIIIDKYNNVLKTNIDLRI